MSDNLKSEVLLVGAGNIAVDYAKVLKDLKREFIVVGRGEQSAKNFEQATDIPVHRGGLDKFISENDALPNYAIVAVTEELLASTCITLLKNGVKNVLLEKPGAWNFPDFHNLMKTAKETSANVVLGYNRRFYSSTRKALEYIAEDGGVTSFQFEFTEWLHAHEAVGKLTKVLPYLFLSNSVHVVDLAFFLCGKPKEISCYKMATFPANKITSIFAGAGISENKAPFTYQANWLAPGRWGVEVLTNKHRLIFRPLEKLQIQQMRSVKIDFVEIDDSLDVTYKPGLFLETKAFLEKNDDFKYFCTLEEQFNMLPVYHKMSDGVEGL